MRHKNTDATIPKIFDGFVQLKTDTILGGLNKSKPIYKKFMSWQNGFMYLLRYTFVGGWAINKDVRDRELIKPVDYDNYIKIDQVVTR